MEIQDLKDKCNLLYRNTIELFEKYGEYRLVSKNLLDVASMLLDIGKIDVSKQKECEIKAQKLLTISKELNVSKNIYKAYFTLTNNVLPFKKNTINQTVEKKEIINDFDGKTKHVKEDVGQNLLNKVSFNDKVSSYQKEAVPSNFKFDWDNLPSITFDDVAGLDNVKNEK